MGVKMSQEHGSRICALWVTGGTGQEFLKDGKLDLHLGHFPESHGQLAQVIDTIYGHHLAHAHGHQWSAALHQRKTNLRERQSTRLRIFNPLGGAQGGGEGPGRKSKRPGNSSWPFLSNSVAGRLPDVRFQRGWLPIPGKSRNLVHGSNFLLQPAFQFFLGNLQIIVGLEVHPALGVCAKKPGKP